MLRLRQIALAVEDLSATCAELGGIMGLVDGYDDPAVQRYGLRNAVFAVGGIFLEVLTPARPDTSVGRLLAKRGGDCGYMVILQSDAIAADRARVATFGVRVVDQFDGEGASFTHLHPSDTGGALLSIDHMEPWDRWDWGGPDWQAHATPAGELAIIGAEIGADDPAAMAGRWARLLDRAYAWADDRWRITLDEGFLDFADAVDGAGEGLRAISLQTRHRAAILRRAAQHGRLADDDRLMIGGVAFHLVEAA